MTETIDTVKVGSRVHFKLCDSAVIHAAEVLDIEVIPAGSVYSPAYKIFTCKDDVTGWIHRLTQADLRYWEGPGPARTDDNETTGTCEGPSGCGERIGRVAYDLWATATITCAFPGDQEHDHEMCHDVIAEENGADLK